MYATKIMTDRLLRKILTASFIAVTCQPLVIETTTAAWFDDVTSPAGLAYSGRSFGASWGDFNGDGWPDLWVSNHSTSPNLYLNNRDGTFTNATNLVDYQNADMHGAAWADFDNDGDQDLLQIVGGGSGRGLGQNQLFVNNGGLLQEEASARGIDYPLARGRSPLWFDWNGDGYLDMFLANILRPDRQAASALFTQREGSFTNENNLAGIFTTKSNEFAQLLRLMNLNSPAMVVGATGYPDKIYRYDSIPFQEISGTLGFPLTPNVTDIAVADLNGDSWADLYLSRSKDSSGAVNPDSKSVKARLKVNGDEKGIMFRSTGNVRFRIGPNHLVDTDNIYIGRNGANPQKRDFTLSRTDPVVGGLNDHVPGADFGVFVGYNARIDAWELYVSNNSQIGLNIVIDSDTAVEKLVTVGFSNSDSQVADRLLVQNLGTLMDATPGSGLDTASSCVSVTAADFDNDMDVDLYLVCRGPAANQANILYENLGNSGFRPVPAAGGAQGGLLGLGESAVAADYNQDGFVDLFVTNGAGGYPFGNGPSELYRNVGGNNYWLEIDLEGTASNRDGIGARLLATAGGVTQLREQSGGMHRFAQDHQRIHFGLADNRVVDQLVIEWPSGVIQKLNDIPANQVVRVIEPGLPSINGEPEFQPGLDSGVYLWKETFDGPYRLRMSSDGNGYTYTIQLVADTAFDRVLPYQLSGGDVLEWDKNYISLNGGVSIWEDGIDFALPPGTTALISVELDGTPNPRQMHIGSFGQPLSPRGWIVRAENLPAPPSFKGGSNLGMFIGRDSSSSNIRIRWNGDGLSHRAETELLFSEPVDSVTPAGFESSDTLVVNANSMVIDCYVSKWWDGIDIGAQPGTLLGFVYSQDGLVQPYRVNPLTRDFGLPNAYQLPQAEPYGQPKYDSAVEAGLFIWKDESSNRWHLRATAGGGRSRYAGEIVSSAAIPSFTGHQLEASDIANQTNPTQILFDLTMVNQWEDGFDFEVPGDADLQLNLSVTATTKTDAARVIRIGERRWPISQLPIKLQ